ncbi:hypothetical protein BpHYR1_023487, partial [Brachionus plicatilis]
MDDFIYLKKEKFILAIEKPSVNCIADIKIFKLGNFSGRYILVEQFLFPDLSKEDIGVGKVTKKNFQYDRGVNLTLFDF